MQTKPPQKADELNGPLLRIRTAVTTERFNPSTKEWMEAGLGTATQYTVVRRGDTIDVETTQPVLDVEDLPLRALLRRIIQLIKENL